MAATLPPRRFSAVGAARPDPSTGRSLAVPILALLIAVLLGYAYGMTWRQRPLSWAPLLLPAFIGAGAYASLRLGRLIRDPLIPQIVFIGWLLRLLGLLPRYDLAVDALAYHEEGVRLAASYRQFQFSGLELTREVPGTGAIQIISGLVHAVFFDNLLATFLVFTFAAFLGSLAFIRAVQVALPDADVRRYTLLLMLWPSLFFWPSSLGKEALMLLGLGLASLGVAHIYSRRATRGLAWFVVGMVPLVLVRPHVALLVLGSLAVSSLLRKGAGSFRVLATRIAVGLLVLLAVGSLANLAAERLNIDSLGGLSDLETALDQTEDQSSQGGASFNPARVTSPLDYPLATVTVLFRPLPGEVRDVLGLVSSLENMALLLLGLVSWRRVVAALRTCRRDAYLLYAFVYTAAFVFAFSAIANFGILARQRTQVLPMVFLALVVVPVVREVTDRRALKRVHPREESNAAATGPDATEVEEPAPEVEIGPARPRSPLAAPRHTAIGRKPRDQRWGTSGSTRRSGDRDVPS